LKNKEDLDRYNTTRSTPMSCAVSMICVLCTFTLPIYRTFKCCT